MIDVNVIKKLREETGAGVADVRMALEEAKESEEKAKDILKEKGATKASKKAERVVKSGVVEVYSHSGRIGVVFELLCETDFVARTADFKNLAHELALQVASMDPQNSEELLSQEYIRDSGKTIKALLEGTIAKLGENIQIGKFCRIALGE